MQNMGCNGSTTIKKRRVMVVISTLIFLFVGCFSVGSTLAAEPRSGGTLIFGAENEFAGFDMLKTRGFAICDAIANNTIQERLFDMDDDGKLIPILGLSATSSDNGKAWTIKLRQGVVFHDGKEFNADAVIHHWSRILNPKNRYRGRAFMTPIQSVEKVDDFTIRFNLKHPWQPFPGILSGARGLGFVIPSPTAVDADTQKRKPVGTGPFMFKEWISGDRFVVVKNPNYWQKGKPYLNEIIFKFVPDHQTRFASLKSGQMSVIWMDRGGIIDQAMKDATLAHYKGEGAGAEIFVLNTTLPPLDDPRVRRALAHAWNQDVCVKISYRSAIPSARDPFGGALKCGDVGYRDFDPEKAGQLIADYGKPVELECLHSNTKRGREQGELLQQFGKKIGITVNPVGLSFGPVIKKVITKNYQISTWRIPSATDPGPGFFVGFHSKSRANVSGYNNPEMDKLLVAQRMETDPQKRRQMLCDIATLINTDVPIIYRGGRRYHVIAQLNVKGIEKFRNGIVRLSEAWLEK